MAPKTSTRRRVLHVASECYPLIKTGGLADVVGALPIALDATGQTESTIFLPGFPSVLEGPIGTKAYAKTTALDGSPVRLVSGQTKTGLRVIAADCAPLFGYAGNPYQNEPLFVFMSVCLGVDVFFMSGIWYQLSGIRKIKLV